MTTDPSAAAPSNSSDRILAVSCHLAVFVGMYFIVPLVIFFVKRDESKFVAEHAKEAINFHLSLLIYLICCVPLVFVLIGIPIMIVLGIIAMICSVIAAIRAADNAYYRYPLTIRFF